jgi:hypothetical protein
MLRISLMGFDREPDRKMIASQKFQKALMLLDRGAIERGEALLREVVTEAEGQDDQVTLVQGLLCLGELLVEVGRVLEARDCLERALTQGERNDDVVAYELARARELLGNHCPPRTQTP